MKILISILFATLLLPSASMAATCSNKVRNWVREANSRTLQAEMNLNVENLDQLKAHILKTKKLMLEIQQSQNTDLQAHLAETDRLMKAYDTQSIDKQKTLRGMSYIVEVISKPLKETAKAISCGSSTISRHTLGGKYKKENPLL